MLNLRKCRALIAKKGFHTSGQLQPNSSPYPISTQISPVYPPEGGLTRIDPAWQTRQALRHEAAKNWFAAASHWGVLLRGRPDDADLKWRQEQARAALEGGS